jgi:cytochrome c-type biogenesis protein CcmH
MTARLAKKLEQSPNDLDGWLLLGRSYTVLEQYPLAVRAFQRADRLADGKNADAIVGVAESLVAQDSEQIKGAAGRLFERALEIDPTNGRALFYGSFAALARGEYPVARERFTRMLALNPPPEVRSIIEQRIAEIDAAMSGQAMAGQGMAPGAQQGTAAGAADEAARVAVHVTLAPALVAKIPRDAPLFVAARDPKSPGPPFAVKRLAAQFPVDVELTAADAMMPTRRISTGQQLEVVARVALGGTPTATSGDPFGQVSYHVGTDGKLNIVIDRLAP